MSFPLPSFQVGSPKISTRSFSLHVTNFLGKAIQWTFTSVAVVLSLGRYCVRYRTTHTVGLSDVFHALALVFLLAFTVQATISASIIKKIYFPDSSDELTAVEVNRVLYYQLASGLTFLISLYCVKFSFLFLYRQIFWVSQSFTRPWWIVTLYTFLTFWPCLVTNIANCGGNVRDRFNACRFAYLSRTRTSTDAHQLCACQSQTSRYSTDFQLWCAP